MWHTNMEISSQGLAHGKQAKNEFDQNIFPNLCPINPINTQ